MKKILSLSLLFLFLVSIPAFALTLTSDAFKHGDMLPRSAGYDRDNISPKLEWTDIPEGTQSFALIVDDPDARGWVHWLVYNIPGDKTNLREDFPRDERLRDGTMQGCNSWSKISYGGPSPPSGTHRYVFKLYALDAVLDLKPGIDKAALVKAMKGHILEETELMGKYKK